MPLTAELEQRVGAVADAMGMAKTGVVLMALAEALPLIEKRVGLVRPQGRPVAPSSMGHGRTPEEAVAAQRALESDDDASWEEGLPASLRSRVTDDRGEYSQQDHEEAAAALSGVRVVALRPADEDVADGDVPESPPENVPKRRGRKPKK